MIKINKFNLVLWAVILTAINVRAEESFVNILKSLTADRENIVSEIPDIDKLQAADSVQKAGLILQGKTFVDVKAKQKKASVLDKNQLSNLIRKRQLTFVIVPGVLGEFIDTRAFEEIFSKNSNFKNEWSKIVSSSKADDNRYDLQTSSLINENLDSLVNAGSIDANNGDTLLKVVILKTYLGSMESVGSDVEKARIFNRRLQKYFELTQDQNLVMIGYSRGTPLALEMITQAEKEGLSYVKSVKTLISYAGVVSGSALADVTDDTTTESGKMFAAAKTLLNELQTANSVIERPYRFAQNSAAISKFTATLAQNSKFDPNAFLTNARSGDFKTVAALIAKVSAELGFTTLYDFNGHVLRVKKFITEVMTAVDGLKSRNLEQWWKTHKLPRHIKYMSIAAAMVDPEKNELEKAIFSSKQGYNDSLDDKSLLENKRTYEKITGVALNDSQVAVHQTIFLSNAIAKLNAANAGLDIRTLGLLETHHWGVSLEVVNKMKDGRLNPFPRDRVLLALSAYLNQ